MLSENVPPLHGIKVLINSFTTLNFLVHSFLLHLISLISDKSIPHVLPQEAIGVAPGEHRLGIIVAIGGLTLVEVVLLLPNSFG